MKRLSGTLLAILLAALLGMGVMAFTTAAPETSAPPASDTDPVPELPEPVREPDWRLTLVNEANPLPEDYEPDTAEADNGYLFDIRAVEPLRALLQAGREAGLDLVVTSGWRSWAYQEQLFEDKVARVMSGTGLDRAAAEELAADEVARPGTSEHQLGLAMDIAKKNSSQLNTAFAETEEGQWVAANAHRFGFIVRYLKEYEDVTGYMYEPWHVRYVGKEQAQAIYESGVPMETYMTGYKLGVYDFLIHQATNE